MKANKEQSFTTKKFRQIDRHFPFYNKGDENFVPQKFTHNLYHLLFVLQLPFSSLYKVCENPYLSIRFSTDLAFVPAPLFVFSHLNITFLANEQSPQIPAYPHGNRNLPIKMHECNRSAMRKIFLLPSRTSTECRTLRLF